MTVIASRDESSVARSVGVLGVTASMGVLMDVAVPTMDTTVGGVEVERDCTNR